MIASLCIGAALEAHGNLRAALTAYEGSATISRRIADIPLKTDALNADANLEFILRQLPAAQLHADQARRLSASFHYREGEARALTCLGAIASSRNTEEGMLEAKAYFDLAMSIWSDDRHPRDEVLTLTYVGYLLSRQANEQGAMAAFQKALSLSQSIADDHAQAQTLQDMGNSYERLGQLDLAYKSYRDALELFTLVGDFHGKAVALDDLGYYREATGSPDALPLYKRALIEADVSGDPLISTVILGDVSRHLLAIGHALQALKYCSRELHLARQIGDGIIVSQALRDIGEAYLSLDDPRRALVYFQQASGSGLLRDGTGEKADAQIEVGRTLEKLNRLRDAMDLYASAASASHLSSRSRSEADARYHLAKLLAAEHQLDSAKREIAAAIEISESLRSAFGASGTKTFWFATIHQYYELYVEVLMQLHNRNSTEHFDRLAFAISEQSRARSLLDLLYESRVPVTLGVDPKLVKQEADLLRSIYEQSEHQLELLGRPHDSKMETSLADNVRSLERDDEELKKRIGARNTLQEQAQSIDVQSAQTLLDDDDLVLEYFLGDQRSYAWAITRNDFDSYTLAGRVEIEDEIKRFRMTLLSSFEHLGSGEQRRYGSGSRDHNDQENARNLARVLLAPVTSRLKYKRIIIIGDGALQYLPFAALPISLPNTISRPGPISQYLQTNHQIVHLPSLSALTMLRSRQVSQDVQSESSRSIAIFADPVFEHDDPRILKASKVIAKKDESPISTNLPVAIRDISGSSARLPRLPGTRQEADAIMALFQDARSKEALGFDANLNAVTKEDLSEYRIIHFATHSLIDATRPEDSGIVLSLFDRSGASEEGYLRLKELYTLRLSAKLVVLSACDTALGKDVRGEGMIGLVRGFMYAGVPSIVATLWKVDDDATKEFMQEFYRNLIQKNETPAEALHDAQAAMIATRIRQDPYYWAAFVLEGDWRRF